MAVIKKLESARGDSLYTYRTDLLKYFLIHNKIIKCE